MKPAVELYDTTLRDGSQGEGVNALGDAEFVRDREVDAFALRAIAQGRIVEFDCWFHSTRQSGARILRQRVVRSKSKIKRQRALQRYW